MKPELIRSLKGYKPKNILNDLFAGLMVAIIALPLSIALGIQSVPDGMPGGIQYGLITAIIAGFFISALGGSKFQIGGPTAAFVAILVGYLADPQIGPLGLAIAGIMAGALLIIMGGLRLGSVMKFFPYPITIGFTTGIGITLIVGQIKDFLGLNYVNKVTSEALGSELIKKIELIINNISTIDWVTLGVAVFGFLIIILLPKLCKKIPAAFVALILCTGLTAILNAFAGTSIATIGSQFGKVEAGFNVIDFGAFGTINFGALIMPAIVIAFLCAIESLLSATVAAGMTNTTFNANQELFGQGVANICSSLLGGLPATGAIARTAASIENGAKSPLAGMFHAIFLLIFYFALMSVLQYIPLCVFAAILMSVAINMSRFKLFGKLTAFGVRDSIVLIVTCLLTVVFDLTYGVIGGVVITILANVMNFKKGLKISYQEKLVTIKKGALVEVVKPEPKAKKQFKTVEISEEIKENVNIEVGGAIFFANVGRLVGVIEKVMVSAKSVTVDLSKIETIDETCIEKLGTLNKKFKANDKQLVLANANEKTQSRINKYFNKI